MSDLILLPGSTGEPVPEVVALAREMLEMAEAGTIRSLAVATCGDDGCVATTYERGDAQVCALHYAAAQLQQRLLDHQDPERGPR